MYLYQCKCLDSNSGDGIISDILKHSQGNYTEATIRRAGKMVGNIGKTVDQVFHHNIAEVEVKQSHRSKFNYQEDISTFVAEYMEENLFSFIPGREHSGFKGFTSNSTHILEPEKLKARLLKYTKKLDRSRGVLKDRL